MAAQPPEEQSIPQPLTDGQPAKTVPEGVGGPAADSERPAQPAISQPATSQGQDATPSTKEDPIWISKREVRKAAPRTSGSKKTTYFIEFYLVDNHGYETLAATGEDQGDAHYTYRNAVNFQAYGNLEVHNRKELLSWLDKIIEGTQKAHNFHLVSDDDDVLSASVAVTPGSPVNLPTFITTREQKSHDEGGRRRQQWWLVDDNGHEHLAVVGEERDPRDGHYNYYAEKPFSLIRPLACQNRTKVHEYLETFITHPGEEQRSYTASPKKLLGQELPGGRSGAAVPGLSMLGLSEGQAQNVKASQEPGSSAGRSGQRSTASRRGGATGGRGKGDSAYKGSKSGKSSKKGIKRSASFAFGPADGEPGTRRRSEEEAAESAAQDAVTAELQRRAAAKAAWQSAARRSALEWLRSPVTEAAARAVADWQATLQGALSELYAPAPSPAVPQLAPPPFATVAPSSPMLQPNGLGAMRLSDETAGLFPMSSSGVSLPMMLNGLLAYSQPQGPHPQQQLGPSLPILGLQQPQQHCEGDAATPMMIDGGTSASAPEDGVGARRVNARALTEALDAMREPSSLHATLPLFASTGLVDTFKQLANHHEAPIAGLARATLEHWRKVWAHHMDVLLDPAYLADPRAEAKALLKAITEQVGAEKCRREPKTPALSMRPQMSGGSLSAPHYATPGSLAPPLGNALGAGAAALAAPAAAQCHAMAPILPPSALALPNLPGMGMGAPGLPEGPMPHVASAHGLNLLALLQSTGRLPGNPASFLSALSAGMQTGPGSPMGLPTPVTPADGDLAKSLEGRRLQFASPAGPTASTEVIPSSAAGGVAAVISRLTPLAVESPAMQEGPSTPTGSPALSKEQMTGQHTQRVASRLRPTSALMGSQGAPTGMEAEHAKRRQDGAVLDSAVLKDIGLTSGEENSDDAWGSSGEEDDEPPTREGLEPNLGDLSLDAVASVLSRQKGRLAASKLRRVSAIAEQTVCQALALLRAVGPPPQALEQADEIFKDIRANASKLSQDSQPGMNSRAKAELEQAVQKLVILVDNLRDDE